MSAFLTAFWRIILDTAPYVILGMVLSGFVHEILSRRSGLAARARHKNLTNLSLFTWGGLALPMCSCGVAPMAVGLRRGHGLPLGSVLAFLFSAPATSVTAIILASAMLGWQFTIYYLLGGLICGYTIGLVFYLVENRPAWAATTPGPVPVQGLPMAPEDGRGGLVSRALQWGLGVYGSRIAFDQIIGLALCALAVTVFSVADLSAWLNRQPYLAAGLLMVLVALPLFVCSLPAIVMAATFAAGGLKPELVWIFLMAGPVTNLGDMNVLRRQFGFRNLALYVLLVVLVVFGWSLILGAMVDPLAPAVTAQQYLLGHTAIVDTCLLPFQTAAAPRIWDWWALARNFFAPMYLGLILLGALAAGREFLFNPCAHCRHWQEDLGLNPGSCARACWKKTVFKWWSPRIAGSLTGRPKIHLVGFGSMLVLAVAAGGVGAGSYLMSLTSVSVGAANPEDLYRPIPTYLDSLSGYAERFSSSPDQDIVIRYAGSPADRGARLTGFTVTDLVTGRKVLEEDLADLTLPVAPCASYRDQGCDFPGRLVLPGGQLTPGLYALKLETDLDRDGYEIYFNIRPDPISGLRPRCAVMLPSLTWQAYNALGGHSFYTDGPPALRKVSRLRPVQWDEDNTMASAILFPRFLRQIGIDFFTMDDFDLHDGAEVLNGVDLLMIIVHDEYWTWEMRRNLEAFLKRGGRLLVAAGNTCWAKVRLEGTNIVIDHRPVEQQPPESPEQRTGLWLQTHIADPCEKTFGLTWDGAGYALKTKFPTYEKMPDQLRRSLDMTQYQYSGAMFVQTPDHPVFKGTGLVKGRFFGAGLPIVYKEVDGLPVYSDGSVAYDLFPEAPRPLVNLAGAWAWSFIKDRPFVSTVMAEFSYQGRGRVLNLGSIGWYKALEKRDPLAWLILKNAVNYMLEAPDPALN